MKKILAAVVLTLVLSVFSFADPKPANPTPEPPPTGLNPNSVVLLNNVLDHLKDAQHALHEASTDRDGHHRRASELLQQTIDEINATKKSLIQECGKNCAGDR